MKNDRIRVLYSFPHKIGAGGICYSASEQVKTLSRLDCAIDVYTGVVHKPLPENVTVTTTLSLGKLRISYKLFGAMRAMALHDRIVARSVLKNREKYDIIHVWPSAALETIKAAHRAGIPTVLERPNAHTKYAYEVVRKECERIGVPLPPDNEYSLKGGKKHLLEREEEEFRLSYRLACPSEFTRKTFMAQGYAPDKLLKYFRGVDDKRFFPDESTNGENKGFTMLFVGTAAVRKGVHFALEAWLASPASQNGTFLIAGEFLPAYADKLSTMLSDPSVKVLGQRKDVPELMRQADILVLPSIEEGFGKVCTEAIASGCVPLVSEACTDLCRHRENALVHKIGDVKALEEHITAVYKDKKLLEKLRLQGLKDVPMMTWDASSKRLLDLYRETIDNYKAGVQL